MSVVTYLHRAFRAAGMVLAAVVIVNGALFAYLLGRLGPDLDGAIANARTVREIHEAMLDQETALRGFLLTGDDGFLATYASATRSMDAVNETADRELAPLPAFSADLLAMRIAQQQWVDRWAAAAAQGPVFADEPDRQAFIDEGRDLFDAYRSTEERMVSRLVAERDRLLERQRLVLLGAGAAALVLGAGLFLVAARERRRLGSLVVEPVEDLRAAMRQLSGGDLSARASGAGAAEFVELAASLDAMAQRLGNALRESEAHVTELAERSERQGRILVMARDIAGSLNLRYVVRSIAEHAHAITTAQVAVVWVVHEDGETTLVEAWRHEERAGLAGTGTTELGQGLAGEVARDGRAKTADVHGTPAVSVGVGQLVSAVAVPMIVGARVVGVVEARLEPPRHLDPDLVTMLETLCSQGGTAVEAARLHETAVELSQIDALTRLFNRLRLDTDLATELARAVRYDRPLSFVMADIDHFKQFNDMFGHQRGDEVLEEVARLLVQSVRASDTVYRYGGEELSIVLRETDDGSAADLAERLRARVERHFTSRPGLPGVTLSFGISSRRSGSTDDPEALILAADRALYEAKRAGRNRVVAADELGDPLAS